MVKNRRPRPGAKARELEMYAISLGWTEDTIKNGGHSVWIKNGHKVAIGRSGKQPIATGTLAKICKVLESV